MIKGLGIRNKRVKQSDPRLAWFMFQNIYRMYLFINNKEETNEDILLTSMSVQKESNKANKKHKYLRDNNENNQPLLLQIIIFSDLNGIQPRNTKV